jgi:hypothetical protein
MLTATLCVGAAMIQGALRPDGAQTETGLFSLHWWCGYDRLSHQGTLRPMHALMLASAGRHVIWGELLTGSDLRARSQPVGWQQWLGAAMIVI